MDVEKILSNISEEGELWKPCPEFEKKYLISSHGRILGIGTYNTCKKGELIRQHKKHGRNWYMQVRLYDNGRARTFETHVLVARAFIPNPDNLPMINHKDEDKTNNHVENLEWCDCSYNIRYSHAIPIDVYSKEGVFIETFEAISIAAERYNISTTEISRCCKSKCGTSKGFQFRYKGEHFVPKPFTEYKRRLLNRGKNHNRNRFRTVYEYTIDGNYVKTWDNITSAADANDTTTGNICKCYKGKILTNKGKIYLLDNNIKERLNLLKNRKHKSRTESYG